jgi:hypothetical protein
MRKPEEGVFVCPHKLLLENHLNSVGLNFPGKDDSLTVDGDIGVMEVVPSQHLEEQIASSGSNLPQMFDFSGMLLSVGVDGRFEDNPHSIFKVLSDFFDL